MRIPARLCVRWSVCLTLFLLGCSPAWSPSSPPSAQGVPKQLLSRQILVVLTDITLQQRERLVATLMQKYQLTRVGAFPLVSIGAQCVVFQLAPKRSMDDVLMQLRAEPFVHTVQPNQLFHSLQVVWNDPYARLQYGLRAIRADRAHQVASGKGIRVAVIDTGIDVDHPDLHGRIARTENFVEGGDQTFRQDRHGTAVAGIIVARADNDIGIVGVAPEAQVLALKACWHQSVADAKAVCSSWTLARAIDFAILHGAQIINMSLAGPADALLTQLLTSAMARGIVVIAAAPDTAPGPGFPASLAGVIAALASDTHSQVRFISGLPNGPLLAAPGIEVLTTLPHSAYDFLSGSSLAAAHVSGIVALLLEHDATLTPARLRTLLHDTGRPAAMASAAGVRILDACSAVERLVGTHLCS